MGHADFRPGCPGIAFPAQLLGFWAALLNPKEWRMWMYEYVEWVNVA